jgi:hypothetical protein
MGQEEVVAGSGMDDFTLWGPKQLGVLALLQYLAMIFVYTPHLSSDRFKRNGASFADLKI